MNNKGLYSLESGASILRIGLIILALSMPIYLASTFLNTTIDTTNVEATILIQRLLYSQEGLAYYNPTTQLIEQGVIDWNKFNTARNEPGLLDDEIISGYGAKISFGKHTGYTIYYNKKQYDNYIPLAQSKLGGKGSVAYITKELPVILDQGGIRTAQTASIEVIIP